MKKWAGMDYEGKRYRTRADASKNALLGRYPERVEFRFERVWIIVDPDVLTTVYTASGEALIGYNDPYMPTHGIERNERFVEALVQREIDAKG